MIHTIQNKHCNKSVCIKKNSTTNVVKDHHEELVPLPFGGPNRMRSIALTEIFCRWMAFLIFKTFLVKLLFWMAMLKQVFNISLLQVVENHNCCIKTIMQYVPVHVPGIYKFSCTETFFISIKWLQRSIISFSQKNPLSRNLNQQLKL